jgi:hypothetical protein
MIRRTMTGGKRMAPRDGLEPPTYWLQVPRNFFRAWTISSPVPRRGEGVGRFPRPVRETPVGGTEYELAL